MLPQIMSDSLSSSKRVSPLSLAVDALLCLGFFALIYWLVSGHVPSRDPKMTFFFGSLASACMTGVFWLCIQMFRVVLGAQLASRKNT